MLDLDYIKENTIWVVKFNVGRTTCTDKDLHKYEDNEEVRDIDIYCWEGQPKELQEFLLSKQTRFIYNRQLL